MENKPVVCITGITGFIGSIVTRTFLTNAAKDGFTIRGTVRDKTNAKRLQPLKDAFGDLFNQLELVNADLNNEASLDEALKGATYLIHTASPFTIDEPKDPQKELIDPAVNGTLYALRAAHKHGVKRVVLTSSCVSIMYTPDRNRTVVDEKYWTSVKDCDPYSQSKTLAEQAAWAHQRECGNSYELAVINPGLVMGTPIVSGSYSSSDVAKMFLTGKGPMPALVPLSMPLVDVQNVADAHHKACIVPEAKSRRFVLAYDAPMLTTMGGWVTEKYESQGFNTMKKRMGAFPMNCLACCVFQARFYMNNYQKQLTVNNSPAKEILGIDLIDSKTALYKMCDAQIANGYA